MTIKLFLLLTLIAIISSAELTISLRTGQNSKLNLKKGDKILVKIDSNISTGFSWFLEPTDTKIIRLINPTSDLSGRYFPNVMDPESEMVGAGGITKFRFRAKNQATAYLITFIYKRSWGGLSTKATLSVNIE